MCTYLFIFFWLRRFEIFLIKAAGMSSSEATNSQRHNLAKSRGARQVKKIYTCFYIKKYYKEFHHRPW